MQVNPVRVELPWERIGRLQAGFCLAQPEMPPFQASTVIIEYVLASCHVLYST